MTFDCSVTRLGDFWKFLATNSLSKVAKKIVTFGLCRKRSINVKTALDILRQLLKTFGQLLNPASGHIAFETDHQNIWLSMGTFAPRIQPPENNAEIKYSDWLLQIMWLVSTKLSSLFQYFIGMLLKKLLNYIDSRLVNLTNRLFIHSFQQWPWYNGQGIFFWHQRSAVRIRIQLLCLFWINNRRSRVIQRYFPQQSKPVISAAVNFVNLILPSNQVHKTTWHFSQLVGQLPT